MNYDDIQMQLTENKSNSIIEVKVIFVAKRFIS